MATKKKKTDEPTQGEFKWPFGTRNYIVFAIALVVIILGYVTLAQGSLTLAPLLLVIGYCVLIPVALIIKDPSIMQQESDDEPKQPANI
ncbi:MAG: hypothetical protein DRP47_01485 [Candidatus Zixiibacteriota bacterium]|nr:MAG: hypothetical protein DRP47_01485 [candidate division Zixibacteria bacterium]